MMEAKVPAFPQLGYDKLLSVRSIAFAQRSFEPFPAAIIPRPVLESLVDVGIVEAGPSCRPSVSPTGYRLTDAGWRVACANWSVRRLQEPRFEAST
jgi:hypothetical protein